MSKKILDAFAFRGFDSSRILQRPFFKAWREKYHVDTDVSDEEILATLVVTDSDELAELEEKNLTLREISSRLSKLCDLVDRQADLRKGRLENCRRQLMKKLAQVADNQISFLQDLIVREQKLLGFYTSIVMPAFTDLTAYVAVLVAQTEKALQAEYRRRFGERLKTARENAGLSRKDLADELNLTVVGYGLYERGERELTILAITRLAKILKVSSDKLFGLE